MGEFKKIGVVGGGQMGSGIAQLATVYGLEVWLHDSDPVALSRAHEMVSSKIQSLVSKDRLSEYLAGMKFGTNHPMGPLQLADHIGLDVCLLIMRVLHAGLGDVKYAPCPLLVQYVDTGRLGWENGIGVYHYSRT